MKNISSAEELYSELRKMDKSNSVSQFSVPGKGIFTLVFQGSESSIEEEIDTDEELKKMIHESLSAYERGDYQTTAELLKFLAKEDFK